MPLSMDMYTPAIPDMTTYFGASEAEINLTLVLYLVFFSAGLLLFGPISDKVGRKPVLAGGMVVFAVANVFCAIAPSIVALVAARVFATLGAENVVSFKAASTQAAAPSDQPVRNQL